MPPVLAQSNLPKSAAVVVSSETIVLRDPNNSILEKYTSDEQKQLSLKSYGIKPATMLSPGENKVRPSGSNLKFFEWLQTDGKAYVNTGIDPPFGYKYVFEAQHVAGVPCYFLGCMALDKTSQSLFLRFLCNLVAGENSTLEFHVYSSATSNYANVPYNAGDKIKLEMGNGKVKVNDDVEYDIPNFNVAREPNAPFFIFARNNNGEAQIGGLSRFYYCKIFDANDNLIANFVPATLDDVPGLYDSISKVFYGNAAAEGSFSIGNGTDFPQLNLGSSLLGGMNNNFPLEDI